MKTDIAVVGAGAAGMFAALIALRHNPLVRVVLLERLDRPGKKLLATGNGRCNYTNIHTCTENYHGAKPGFVGRALQAFSSEDAISLFREIGVFPRIEEEGKVFPYSGNASSVLDALRFELDRLGAEIKVGSAVIKIVPIGSGYTLSTADGTSVIAKKVILAAGGKASPALGSDGSGYALLTQLDHHITELSPALTQIKTQGSDVRPLQGIKIVGNASAIWQGNILATQNGEILFTSFGLSGPPIFQLSAKVAEKHCDAISLDLMPELRYDEVLAILEERRLGLGHLTLESFFSGLINKRVGNLIARRAGMDKLTLPVSALRQDQLKKMASSIKSLVFAVSGVNGWENAQVTAGGAVTFDFAPETMESLLHPGLYAVGEVLDIFGDCGGFNLQWAWSSGYCAGLHAAAASHSQTEAAQ